MSEVEVKIINNSPNKHPTYSTVGSACMDIASNESVTLKVGEIRVVGTGLFVEIPEGYELQVKSRSGLSTKGIVVANSPGVIDSDYRGEIGVIMHNVGTSDFRIKIGDRVAQISLHEVIRVKWDPVLFITDTVRGDGGFGHTGIK